MFQTCKNCNAIQLKTDCKVLSCQKHFICQKCLTKNPLTHCDQCQIVISEYSIQSERQLRKYPIQGILVHHDKLYNSDGESQFSSRRNCYQRTNGWILCNFLAIVFFFSGLALAIKTSQLGSGVIMTVVGAVGIIASVYFLCKIRKVDKYYENGEHLNQENFIWLKQERPERNERRTISSATTERN